MINNYVHFHTTEENVDILILRGRKSYYDFVVKYREPGKRIRTPKHIHMVIDLYIKKTGNKELTFKLVDFIINEIILKVVPSNSYPPKLQIFSPMNSLLFKDLNQFGEYSVEFIMIVIELLMIQEKTNYPNGVMNLNLFRQFKDEADIFSVVSAATFRGR